MAEAPLKKQESTGSEIEEEEYHQFVKDPTELSNPDMIRYKTPSLP